MNVKTVELKSIFEMLSEKVGEPLDHKGFKEIATAIGNPMTQKFLYEKWKSIRESKESELTIRGDKLNSLLSYLEFGNLQEFRTYFNKPIPEILKSCKGVWMNYVRQNSKHGILYASPVAIFEEKREMKFVLKGPTYEYNGGVTLKNGCLFCQFQGGDKQFHHVYKIGNRVSPKVLQGIFSGVSTSDDPIGGRTVLVKTSVPYDQIKNEQLFVKDLIASEDQNNHAIGTYFNEYEKNNLHINRSMTFTSQDLV